MTEDQKGEAQDGFREPWHTLLNRHDVLIVDTETTGLDERAEVIDVAVIDTTGAVRFDAVSMPVGRIPTEASNIHGLRPVDLKRMGARRWPKLYGELLNVLCGAEVVLAWNASFDARLLAQTSERHGLVLPTTIPWRDLLAEYRVLRPCGRHGLAAAAEREHVAFEGAHRALADCQAVLAVLCAVARDKSKKPDDDGSGLKSSALAI